MNGLSGPRELNVSVAEDLIAANTSVLIASDYEIGAGLVTQIGVGSTLEVL
jgi:hypothetical protein